MVVKKQLPEFLHFQGLERKCWVKPVEFDIFFFLFSCYYVSLHDISSFDPGLCTKIKHSVLQKSTVNTAKISPSTNPDMKQRL